MSAAAVATSPAQPKRADRDRAFCKTRHFFFRSLAPYCTYTEHVCLGLIHDATVGWSRAWANLSIDQFAECAGVSKRFVEVALARLASPEMGWIESRAGKRGGREYRARVFEPHGDDDVTYGKCGACSTIGAMDTDRGFCMTPHSYFRKLPSCVTHAVWLVVGVVMDETLGWNEERADLAVEDVMRDTGLSRRAVQEALAEARELGLIGEQEHSGRPSSYWVCVEQFSQCPKLEARVVTGTPNRERRKKGEATGEETAVPEAAEEPQAPERPAGTRASDFVSRPVVRCRACSSVGPAIEVPDEVAGGSVPVPAPPGGEKPRVEARAGPPTEPKRGRDERIEPELRELYAYLAQWQRTFGEPPSAAVTREISATMAGAPVAYLERFASQRGDYIQGKGRSYKVFLPFARKAAGEWTAERDARRGRGLGRELLAANPRSADEARPWLSRPEISEHERELLFQTWPELRES